MTRYRLTLAAEADLENLFDHGLAAFGPQQARRYRDEIVATLEIIGEFPLLAPEHVGFAPPIRVHHHGRHYVVYVVQDMPTILRIMRDEADLARYLRRLG